jgi:hypothetical protein
VERELILHIPGIERRSGLKEHDPAFFFGDWTMLDSAWHDDKFPLLDPLMMVAEIHAQAAFDYEEELVFVLVMVKHEFAVELHELYMLAVEFGRDARMLEVCNLGELFGDIDFGHDYASGVEICCLFLIVRGHPRLQKKPPALAGGLFIVVSAPRRRLRRQLPLAVGGRNQN